MSYQQQPQQYGSTMGQQQQYQQPQMGGYQQQQPMMGTPMNQGYGTQPMYNPQPQQQMGMSQGMNQCTPCMSGRRKRGVGLF